MLAYSLRRVFYLLITLFFTTLLTFLLIFASGDPAEFLIPVRPGQQPSQALIEQIRKQYGLDQPLWVQYARYMSNILRGNLGNSWYFHRPVSQLIIERFPNTAKLAVAIWVVSLIVGILLGISMAMNKNSLFDRTGIVVSVILISIPEFLIGILLIFIFVNTLGLFKNVDPTQPKTLDQFVLPVLTVALPRSVGYAISLRTTMLNAMGENYVRTARAKGLNFNRTVMKHVLPNALVPIVTMAGIDLAYLLTGVVIVETVFGIPGIGLAAVQATTQRDLPVVMGSVFITAVFIGSLNLVADLITARLDPRIRLEK